MRLLFIVFLLMAIAGFAIWKQITKARKLVDILNNRALPPSTKVDSDFYSRCIGNYDMLTVGFNNSHPTEDVSTDPGALLFYSYCEDQYYKSGKAIDEIDEVEEYKRRFKSD